MITRNLPYAELQAPFNITRTANVNKCICPTIDSYG